MVKKYKVKIIEFEQLNWIPEDGFTIDRHHSLLSTYWLVEIDKKKCIFFYYDIKLFEAEYERDYGLIIAIRPDPNLSKIWSNVTEPDYNSEHRMVHQKSDEYLFLRNNIEDWYNNKEEETETYMAYHDENKPIEVIIEYGVMNRQIRAIYDRLEPNSETKSINDLSSIEFEIKA